MKSSSIQILHRQACLEKQEYYKDPESGYWVATEYYHLKRGSCCQNDCRHCPYSASSQN